MEDGEQRAGGVNAVRRFGSAVIRPAADHSPSVHRLLRHLVDVGFRDAPVPLSLDIADGTEAVSFLPGETADYPLPPLFRTDEALVSAAELIRRYHDATSGFATGVEDRWFLPPRQPAEVICHGDFAPYNCAIRPDGTMALFDFDTAHPGPRVWDVGYAAYRWAPLSGAMDQYAPPVLAEQRRRLHLFLSVYGGLDVQSVLVSSNPRITVAEQSIRPGAPPN
jgi:hypothetical protein